MGPGVDEVDEQRFAELSARLARGLETAIPGWVAANVERVLAAWSGTVDAADADRARRAGQQAASAVGPQIRDLLGRPVDDQTANPLSVVRRATPYATAVLREAGVPPVVRDPRAEELFPDDVYDLTPTSFGDLDPALHEVGIEWGAAKAHLHRRRHR